MQHTSNTSTYYICIRIYIYIYVYRVRFCRGTIVETLLKRHGEKVAPDALHSRADGEEGGHQNPHPINGGYWRFVAVNINGEMSHQQPINYMEIGQNPGT